MFEEAMSNDMMAAPFLGSDVRTPGDLGAYIQRIKRNVLQNASPLHDHDIGSTVFNPLR
jgi:hypothetical protein